MKNNLRIGVIHKPRRHGRGEGDLSNAHVSTQFSFSLDGGGKNIQKSDHMVYGGAP